jgi:hypothetical protein
MFSYTKTKNSSAKFFKTTVDKAKSINIEKRQKTNKHNTIKHKRSRQNHISREPDIRLDAAKEDKSYSNTMNV